MMVRLSWSGRLRALPLPSHYRYRYRYLEPDVRATADGRVVVRAAASHGLPVHVWVADHPGEMRRLLDLGVHGIMTDRPIVLRDVLTARGEWPASGVVRR